MNCVILAATLLASAAPAAAVLPGTSIGTPVANPVAPGSGAAARPSVDYPAPRLAPKQAKARSRHHKAISVVELQVRAANKAATQEPSTQYFLNADQVFPWSEGTIYRIYTAPGQVTDIALQPGEAVSAVASGDTVRWVVGETASGTGGGKQAHVLVKPFTSGLATNLVITTDRRTYHLALASTERTAMASLSWTYPADELIALKAAAEQERVSQPVATQLEVERLHFGYAISGDAPSWRPLRAFDDGRQTFIEFPESLGVGEAPPLFLVDGKGEASLVNYRVNGRFYVVDRLFDAAELRLGLKRQDVVRITRTIANAKRRRA